MGGTRSVWWAFAGPKERCAVGLALRGRSMLQGDLTVACATWWGAVGPSTPMGGTADPGCESRWVPDFFLR